MSHEEAVENEEENEKEERSQPEVIKNVRQYHFCQLFHSRSFWFCGYLTTSKTNLLISFEINHDDYNLQALSSLFLLLCLPIFSFEINQSRRIHDVARYINRQRSIGFLFVASTYPVLRIHTEKQTLNETTTFQPCP